MSSNLASLAGLDPSTERLFGGGQDVPKSRHEIGSILMRFWGTGSGTVQAVWGIRWQLFRDVGSCSRACWMLFPSVAARDRGCARSCVIRVDLAVTSVARVAPQQTCTLLVSFRPSPGASCQTPPRLMLTSS